MKPTLVTLNVRNEQYLHDYILFKLRGLWKGAVAVHAASYQMYCGATAMPASPFYGYNYFKTPEDASKYVSGQIDLPYINVTIVNNHKAIEVSGDDIAVKFLQSLPIWKCTE